MSEEEAIKILKNKHIYFDEYEACEDYETEDAIKTILELYQQEKEKNSYLEKQNENTAKLLHIALNTKDNLISKDKIKEKIEEKLNYYMSYKGLEIFKKDNFKEILLVLEQLKQELLEE